MVKTFQQLVENDLKMGAKTSIRAEVDGFVFKGKFKDLQGWWDNLKKKNTFRKGTELRIWINQSKTPDESLVYSGKPDKVMKI
jgi:hypothetical protein